MNVAVPSAQHSDRLGHPASSHTVTSPRSRTVRLSASTSAPWRTFGRSQSGLRVLIERPEVTPAAASRDAAREVGRTGSPGPAPRENAERSSGRCRHATSWRSATPLPHRSAASRATASTTSRIATCTPSSANDVTGRSSMPQATMCSRR